MYMCNPYCFSQSNFLSLKLFFTVHVLSTAVINDVTRAS